MKKILTILLLLSVFLGGCKEKVVDVGDITVDRVYTKEGKVYLGGSKDLITGRVFLYYEDGGILGDMQVKNGEIYGETNYYHPNGKVKTRSRVVGESVEYRYYSEKGILIESGKTIGDKLDGDFVKYYEDGRFMSKVPYVDGVAQGMAKLSSEDGTLEVEELYNRGKRMYQRSYYDGLLKREVIFNENESKIIEYGNKENKVLEIGLKNGVKNGRSIVYYEDGTIRSETNFVMGIPIGESISYSEDGSIESRINYIRRNKPKVVEIGGEKYKYSGGSTGYIDGEVVEEHYEKIEKL